MLADPKIAALQTTIAALKAATDEYVLANYQDKDDAFESDEWRGTPVRGGTGSWNVVKLQKLVPKGIFMKIVDYVPNAQKIDEAVRAGKLNEKKIAKAYEVTPKAPYVKWTKKTDKEAAAKKGDEEAARLKKAMG